MWHKCSAHLYVFVAINIVININAIPKEKCDRCMAIEDCAIFRDKTQQEQKEIYEEFPCRKPQDDGVFGFSSVAKGDNICCPDINVWGIEIPKKSQSSSEIDQSYARKDNNGSPKDDNFNTNLSNNQNTFGEIIDDNRQNVNSADDSKQNNDNRDDDYEPSRIIYQNKNFNRNNRPIFGNFNSKRPSQAVFGNENNPNYNVPNFNRNFNNNFNGGRRNLPNFNNNSPRSKAPMPGFNGNDRNSNFQNSFARNNKYASQRNVNGQCMKLTSLPPVPEDGCCGREESFSDRITDPYANRRAPLSNSNMWAPPADPSYNFWSPNNARYSRSAQNSTVVDLQNRITGGRETELEQFPWTVLIKTTFQYGPTKSTFSCGGSIISARYVLTAAHCVIDDNGVVRDIDIFLAEYNKSTFPRDCVRAQGGERKCIENILMKAEDYIPHPQYNARKLQSDIALIRLRANAPYSDYVRPICLPPIDIDKPEYSDLRLAVAGWGRNGRYQTQIKQSAIVHLVPQRECIVSYSFLTRSHLCAAGHSGEDTCKGDSGGPLMMLYAGKYYVAGVVSGKRADSPCGTSVPSLYTNVYHYLDWINNNIRK